MAESNPALGLQQTVDDLARRVERLEARLGAAPAASVPPVAPQPTAAGNAIDLQQLSVRKEAIRPQPPRIEVWPPPRTPPAPMPPLISRAPTARTPIPAATPKPAPAKPKPAIAPPKQTEESPATAFGMEGVIGAKWFAAAGAIVVVIGVGLFLKMAYERGWLDRIPPVGKCLTGAMFGALLLGAGELARRKINAVASAGLSAAGIGAIYASAYASHAVYGLVGETTAFALLGASAVLGIAVAARAKLVSVALLSLIGAYMVPVILSETEGSPGVLPAYLLALLAIGLGLSGWKPDPFHHLRRPAWWGTGILGGIWTLRTGIHHPEAALPFLSLFWGAVHAELIVASRRGGMVPGEKLLPGKRLSWRAARPIAASFSTTALAVTLGVAVLSHSPSLPDWLAPAAGTIFTVVLAFGLARNLRVLQDPPTNDSERIGVALATQAGALLIATIALAFQGGWMQVAAWLALGVAAVAAGRWIRSRGLDVYGLVVLTLAAGRLMFLDWWATPVTENGVFFAGLYLSKWTVLVAISGASWMAAAVLLRKDGRIGDVRWKSASRGILAVGLTLLFASLLHEKARFESAATVFVALGVTIAVVGARLRSRGLAVYGLAVLAIASCWALSVRMQAGTRGGPSQGLLFAGLYFNEVTFVMALCGAACLVFAWLLGLARFAQTGRPEVDSTWRAFTRFLLASGLTLVFGSLLQQGAQFGSAATVVVALGVTGAIVGTILKARGLSLFGVGALTLASAWALLSHAAMLAGGRAPASHGFQVGGLVLTEWSYVMALAGAAWLFAARLTLIDATREWTQAAIACATVGIASIAMAVLHPHSSASAVSIAWLALGVATVIARALQRRLALDNIGLAVIGASTVAWAWAYPIAGWFSSIAPVGLHPGLLLALAILGAALGLSRWLSRSKPVAPTTPQVLPFVRVCAIALLWLATSFEAARAGGVVSSDATARLAAVSVWWGLFAVALITFGFVRSMPGVRYAGLALLGVATAKAVFFDLAGVSQGWRVVSFVGLGLLMLGVAVTYSRIAARVSPRIGPPQPA